MRFFMSAILIMVSAVYFANRLRDIDRGAMRACQLSHSEAVCFQALNR